MKGQLIARAELSRVERRGMLNLLERHFTGVTAATFERDLRDKDYVVLLRDAHGAVQGFSTLGLQRARLGGQDRWVLYSGDTIVDRAHWGSPALAVTWIGGVRTLRRQLQTQSLIWLLICSGPRTYRFLPVFFREFFPRFDRPTPFPIQARTAHLARQRYGKAYDRERGLVLLEHPQRLRTEHSPTTGIPNNGHVKHFHALNPGHHRGDELVCYTEIRDDNLTRAGVRMVRAADDRGAFEHTREAM